MKKSAFRLLAFSVFAVLCAVIFPQAAQAKPIIKLHVDHIYLNDPGEATIVGHFENTGNEGAYIKWFDFDLTLVAGNGQQMWADSGIRHEVADIYVAPGEWTDYTFYIQNPEIPEYHKAFRWRCHSSTHWEKAAG